MYGTRRRSHGHPPVFGLLLLASLLVLPLLVPMVGAQDPPPAEAPTAEDVTNTTSGAPSEVMQIQMETDRTFQRISENGIATYTIIARDASVQGTQMYRPTVSVRCTAINETQDAKGWKYTDTIIPKVSHGSEVRAEFQISTLTRPTPKLYSVTFECRAGDPINDVISVFTLTAQVEEYSYSNLRALNIVSNVRPDAEVDFKVLLTHNGNHVKRYFGQVTAPEGWSFPAPPVVVLQPGESREVTVTGIAPRDKMLYISGSDSIIVQYHPDGEPGKIKTAFFPVTVKGFYLHPALIPLTLLTLTMVGVLVFFAVLGRRAVEERILGKPVPPWRIPVERENLQRMMREDPDEYYIVRYYLMVEEHQSALLWFQAFKQATKKDRKRESAWYKVKRKNERKVVRLEKGHNKLIAKCDHELAAPERKAERKKRKLERKLRRKERKAQRKINRKHKKRGKKLEKKHRKKVKKATKRFEKKRDKELRKVEKANKKRQKKGEEPLPLPELEPPTFEEPVHGEPEVVAEAPLMESRYAKRARRAEARAAAKKERLLRKRERIIEKDRRRVDAKSEKLRSRIPTEPTTRLYDEDRYVPEDEVIVEDDRSPVAKWLALPTLEERDRARRRTQVYRARLREAKRDGDEERAARLTAGHKETKVQRRQERKERIRAALAQRKEHLRLTKERERDLKRRQNAIRRDDAAAAPDTPGSGPIPVRPPASDAGPSGAGRRFRVGRRKADAAKETGADETAAAASQEQGQK